MHKILSSLQPYMTSHSVNEMKSCVIHGNRHWLTTQALPNIRDHILAVRDEFTGQSEIVFYHAALIINIRRHNELADSFSSFRELWSREGAYLLSQLNSRWIISALDTFVDHGNPEESRNAMVIVAFFNMLKLAETECRLSGCRPYDPEKLEENMNCYPVLWDGLRSFHLPDDDTFGNMLRRLQKILASEPLFELIFQALLNRAVTGNTVMSRMAQHHSRHLL